MFFCYTEIQGRRKQGQKGLQSIMGKHWKWLGLWICLAMLAAGCGRSWPVLSAQQLQNKTTVLLVSGAGLPQQAITAFQTALAGWRDQRQISYEWMQNTATLSSEQWAKINDKPYDYIIVAGSALVAEVLPEARKQAGHRWILLNDSLGDSAGGTLTENYIALKEVPGDRIRREWDEWVKQQQVLGRAIEWITNAQTPIPSEWAPSEEAETISLSDANGWFGQFQTQVRRHGPSWIVLYAPLDAASLQRVKNLQVPIMNISATTTQIQWDAVLAGVQQQLQGAFQPGIAPYSDTELVVSKGS